MPSLNISAFYFAGKVLMIRAGKMGVEEEGRTRDR